MPHKQLVPCPGQPSCSQMHYKGSAKYAHCAARGHTNRTSGSSPAGRYTGQSASPTAVASDWEQAGFTASLGERFDNRGLTPQTVQASYKAMGVGMNPPPPDVPDYDIHRHVNDDFFDGHSGQIQDLVDASAYEFDLREANDLNGPADQAALSKVSMGVEHLGDYQDWAGKPDSWQHRAYREAMRTLRERPFVQVRMMGALAPLVAPRAEARVDVEPRPAMCGRNEWNDRLNKIQEGCRAAQTLESLPRGRQFPETVPEIVKVREALQESVRDGARILTADFDLI